MRPPAPDWANDPEHGSDARNAIGRNAGDLRYLVRIVTSDQCAKAFRQAGGIDALRNQMFGDAQRQHTFRARANRHPQIGAAAGERHLGLNLNQHAAWCGGAEFGVGIGEIHRRRARADKVGAKGQHHLGLIEKIWRGLTQHVLIHGARNGVVDDFVHKMILGTHRRKMRRQQYRLVSADGTGKPGETLAIQTGSGSDLWSSWVIASSQDTSVKAPPLRSKGFSVDRDCNDPAIRPAPSDTACRS